MTVLLKYIGQHQRQDIYEVDEKKVEALLSRGDFILAGDEPKPKPKPKQSWTEKKIKKWILDNNIPLEYNIKRDTKAEMLRRLEDGGWI